MKIEGRNAIVTGSTRGIGRAVAEALLESGVHTVISSRNAADVEETVAALPSDRARVFGKACDMQDAEQVRALIEFCEEQLGGLDILVNNAGIGVFKSVEKLSPEEWRRTLGTNLDGVFYACHYAIPKMKKRGGGFIINVSSLAAKNAFPNGSAYNASKFGLTGLSEALMQEVRHEDIRVAYVMPGSVDTSFSGVQGKSSGWKLTARDVADVIVDTLQRDPRCLTSRIEMRPSKPPQK